MNNKLNIYKKECTEKKIKLCKNNKKKKYCNPVTGECDKTPSKEEIDKPKTPPKEEIKKPKKEVKILPIGVREIPLSEEECVKWEKNKDKNPRSNYSLVKDGKLYNIIKDQCKLYILKKLKTSQKKVNDKCDEINIKKCEKEGKKCNTIIGRCIKKNDIKLKKNKLNMKINILNNLKIILDYEKIQGNKFKINSYMKAIKIFEEYDNEITSIEDIKKIEGIGDKTKDKINEFIQTGKMKIVEDILKDNNYILHKKLNNVYGIGPAKIKTLVKVIKNFEELSLEENNHLLNEKQKIGIKYYDDLEKRIPYSEGIKHNIIINKIMKNISSKIEFEMVGSYRRKNKDMGDIDILIKDNENFILKDFINKLIENKYIIETLANGKKKFMGICKLDDKSYGRRIDIIVCEKKHYYFTLLYFTGSYQYNIIMRKKALQMGLSLSEYGLIDIKTNKFIDASNINSEEDIFKKLEIEYVKPENR